MDGKNGSAREPFVFGNLLRRSLENHKVDNPRFSTLAQQGDDELVEKFLSENVHITGAAAEQKQTSFWGFYDVVKSLVEGGANVNIQNPGSMWTPLHAATFQEHGKIVMYLLENGADPNVKDSEGRSPADFGSASDKVWAHFAAQGCTRSSKQSLVKNRIIRQTSTSRADNASMVRRQSYDRKMQNVNEAIVPSRIDGDVLANDKSPDTEDRPHSGTRTYSAVKSPWER
ncbi:ankyrin and IPT/TIG repeat-containing protein C26H5.05-like isoform X2 [Dendronephthya gigantea]|uniref:ankyrin and IPT/TIG repeat-containing protein C26H5.05-like isoform X2 n=1 Tax=Dendronephthya gigantea TaxID=151771 RepID=UPI00106D9AB8|nr:ankyrin and IPT/TIG repeat-containing protein C26H5.05-like isoform X2 [Dendronephthya gigantea]